jgi:hypothetical protein
MEFWKHVGRFGGPIFGIDRLRVSKMILKSIYQAGMASWQTTHERAVRILQEKRRFDRTGLMGRLPGQLCSMAFLVEIDIGDWFSFEIF